MWILVALWRLACTTVIALAVALAAAGVWVATGSGEGGFRYSPAHAGFAHDLKITCFVVGALLVLLAGAGNRSTASARRTDWGIMTGFARSGLGRLSPPIRARPGDPTLTASAMFVGSGLVLIALGIVV